MKTNNNYQTATTFDDIIFIGRNHAYGAYFLRKSYSKYLLVAFLTSFTFVASAVITPYLLSSREVEMAPPERETSVELSDVIEAVKPPEIEIPKPIVHSFVPPEVVEEAFDDNLMIVDEIIEETDNSEVPKTFEIKDPEATKEVANDNKPLLSVQEPATFEGGDLMYFNKWVAEHVKYPEEAAALGLEGKVIVQFVIGKTGKVEDINIIRGAYPLLDIEAEKVLNSSPDWKPARQNGRVVRQQFVLPIFFKLTR